MSEGLLRRLLPFGKSNGQKALTTMTHTGTSGMLQMLLPATKVDWAKDMDEDGMTSSVLAAPLFWLMRTFPEAPPIVERTRKDEWAAVADHSLTKLLRRPNEFYSGRVLWMATVLDFAFGNAYWLKIRNANREVIQVWWVPRGLMEPKWPNDGNKFIGHYEYKPGGRTIKIDVEDVVHFRFGLDPKNPRVGLSPLGALVREVAIDDHASNFTAAILKNLGIIGLVVSPKQPAPGTANKEAVKEVKDYLIKAFTGDKRGDPLALGAPTDVQLLQYNMQGFDVAPIRDVSEERVCAAMGIPAAVIGFGTGLQQTKVGATMKEMRQLAWTGGIIPLQEIMADEIDRSLLPDFDPRAKSGTARMRFDTSRVRALWEDNNEKHDRVRKDMLAGMITRAEARRETGRPADDSKDDVYVQPVNVIQLPESGIAPQQPKPSASGNPANNGGGDNDDGD